MKKVALTWPAQISKPIPPCEFDIPKELAYSCIGGCFFFCIPIKMKVWDRWRNDDQRSRARYWRFEWVDWVFSWSEEKRLTKMVWFPKVLIYSSISSSIHSWGEMVRFTPIAHGFLVSSEEVVWLRFEFMFCWIWWMSWLFVELDIQHDPMIRLVRRDMLFLQCLEPIECCFPELDGPPQRSNMKTWWEVDDE